MAWCSCLELPLFSAVSELLGFSISDDPLLFLRFSQVMASCTQMDDGDEEEAFLEYLLFCRPGCSCEKRPAHWPQAAHVPKATLPHRDTVLLVPVPAAAAAANFHGQPLHSFATGPEHSRTELTPLNSNVDQVFAAGSVAAQPVFLPLHAVAPTALETLKAARSRACLPQQHQQKSDHSRSPRQGLTATCRPPATPLQPRLQRFPPPPLKQIDVSAKASPAELHPGPDSAWNPAVKEVLSRHRNAGKVLHHCMEVVSSLLSSGLTVFKIGMTWRPNHRWENRIYGYVLDSDFSTMSLLHRDATRACEFLEAALISHFQDRQGCRNTAPGGEGVGQDKDGSDPEAVSYIYIVHRQLPRLPPPVRDIMTASKSAPPVRGPA